MGKKCVFSTIFMDICQNTLCDEFDELATKNAQKHIPLRQLLAEIPFVHITLYISENIVFLGKKCGSQAEKP